MRFNVIEINFLCMLLYVENYFGDIYRLSCKTEHTSSLYSIIESQSSSLSNSMLTEDNKVKKRKMFWWKQCKFYPYFTAQKEKPDVLCKNHMISYGNVLVARLTLNKTFVFTKLASIDHFIELYSQCSKKEKTFYAVLIGDYRYLYLDIDFKVKFNMPLLKKTRLIKTIIAMLQRFNLSTFNTFCTRSKDSAYFIWDASRKEKFSVHLVNKHLIMHHKVMKQYVRSFRDWIKQKQVLPDNCEIDLNVYHTGYQLWRLPGNHNGNLMPP